MSADASELGGLADDLVQIPARLVPKIRPIVAKGALNVKKQLQAEAKASKHFKSVSRSIGYDLVVGGFAGDASVEAEIGPDKARGGGAGLLMAYWGQSRGGGGSLPDPMGALMEEAPNFLESMFQLTEDLL